MFLFNFKLDVRIFKKFILYFIFSLIFLIGVILRIYSALYLPLASDSESYISGAESLLGLKGYDSFREPTFSLYIIPFLIIFRDSTIAIKAASFTSGVLSIILSFFIFRKVAQKIFEENEKSNDKSTLVGLLVSLYIAFNNYLIFNNGRGLREETITLLIMVIFYFLIFKKYKRSLKNYTIIYFLISALALIHLIAGICIFCAIVIYYIFSKTKYSHYNMSNNLFFIILISFTASLTSWFIFCYFNKGDPFFTFTINLKWIEGNTDIKLTFLQGLIEAILTGFTQGISYEIEKLAVYLGYLFLYLIIIGFFVFYKKREVHLLFLILSISLLALSILFAPTPNIRLLIYYFPFLFFMGNLLFVDSVYKYPQNINITIKFKEKDYFLEFNLILIAIVLYFVFFSIFQIFTSLRTLNLVSGQLYYDLKIFIDIMKLIADIIFILILIFICIKFVIQFKEWEITKKRIVLLTLMIFSLILLIIWLILW